MDQARSRDGVFTEPTITEQGPLAEVTLQTECPPEQV
jgi:hypothetical protein